MTKHLEKPVAPRVLFQGTSIKAQKIGKNKQLGTLQECTGIE